jgi:hypothetical protein
LAPIDKDVTDSYVSAKAAQILVALPPCLTEPKAKPLSREVAAEAMSTFGHSRDKDGFRDFGTPLPS